MRKSQMRGREKEDGGREGGRGGGESERRSDGGTESQRERKLSGPGLKKQLDVDAAEARQHARHHRARQPQRLPRGEWGGGGERDGASSLGASRTRTHAHVHPGTAHCRTGAPTLAVVHARTRARARASKLGPVVYARRRAGPGAWGMPAWLSPSPAPRCSAASYCTTAAPRRAPGGSRPRKSPASGKKGAAGGVAILRKLTGAPDGEQQQRRPFEA